MIVPTFFATVGLASHAYAACSRSMLQDAAAAYLRALSVGQGGTEIASSTLNYTENDISTDIKKGILAEPITVDWSRSIYDSVQCATATEINAASNKHPYVIVTRMLVADGKIASIDSVVADEGDWIFNATSHLKYAKQEKWDPIPEDKRDSRDVIKAAGDAYLDSWNNSTVKVPFGTPCSRLEGGLYTGSANSTANSCRMPTFPEPFKIGHRRYTIDEELGAVDILNGFPWIEKTKPSTFETPSTNFIRVEGGQIRYIHEDTVCQTKNCGR